MNESIETVAGLITDPTVGVDIETLAADLSLESSGIWREYVPGFELLIASTHQRAYQVELGAAIKANALAFSDPKTSQDEKRKLLAPIIAKHLVKGWKGLNVGGKPLGYSVAKATEILGDPRFHHLCEFVLQNAQVAELYRRQREEDAKGN